MTGWPIVSSTSSQASPQSSCWQISSVSTLDDFGQECTPETYRHRIIFMSMMKELEVNNKLYRSDDLYTQRLSDCAARFRPGHRISSVHIWRKTRKTKNKQAVILIKKLCVFFQNKRIWSPSCSWHRDPSSRAPSHRRRKRRH